MLSIPRLRNVLKKLETSSDLAKFLIQRATAAAGILSKEYGAAALATENPPNPNVTSSSALSTSLPKSLSPPNLMATHNPTHTHTHTHTFQKSSTDETLSAATESDFISTETEQEKQQKTITAAIATASVSLFSSEESKIVRGAVAVRVKAGGSNLREHHSYGNDSGEGKENLSNSKMSDAKVKEATQHTCEAVSHQNQKDEESICNGASCGSGSDTEQQNGSVKEEPCFKSSLADILHFMELVGNLKHTKRTGWVLRNVEDCESISGHMYRMSMMTFLLDGSEGLNQIRCMELALVHDLAESLVGDLTPFCGVAKEEKKAMEFKAMEDICKLIEPRGKRIMELFEEYEGAESAESKFVKDLDRLDMVMQAFEYEKRDNCLMKHQEFFDSTEGKFQHPFIKKLVKEICDQRKALSEAKTIANGNLKFKTVTPNCPPCLENRHERS